MLHLFKLNVFFPLFLCLFFFLFVCSLVYRLPSTNEDSYESDDNNEETIPPHCHITIRCTREIAGFNGLSEAVRRLDFRSSVRDRRRFHYICALLGQLVTHKGIANLSGSAQKQLLQMVEEVASHGKLVS